MKSGINKNSIKKIPKSIFGKRKYMLLLLFLSLSAYVFNGIFENAYLNLSYIDETGAINSLDGTKENEMIKNLMEDLKNRKERIQLNKKKEHKNYFIGKEKESLKLPAFSEKNSSNDESAKNMNESNNNAIINNVQPIENGNESSINADNSAETTVSVDNLQPR